MQTRRKYAHLIVDEDIQSDQPPPEGFLKRMQAQREAGNYLDSFHLLGLNDRIAAGALYFDAVWMTGLHGQDGCLGCDRKGRSVCSMVSGWKERCARRHIRQCRKP